MEFDPTTTTEHEQLGLYLQIMKTLRDEEQYSDYDWVAKKACKTFAHPEDVPAPYEVTRPIQPHEEAYITLLGTAIDVVRHSTTRRLQSFTPHTVAHAEQSLWRLVTHQPSDGILLPELITDYARSIGRRPDPEDAIGILGALAREAVRREEAETTKQKATPLLRMVAAHREYQTWYPPNITGSTSDIERIYTSQAEAAPRLTEDEEARLSVVVQAGLAEWSKAEKDQPYDQQTVIEAVKAYNTFMLSNQRLVLAVARKMGNNYGSFLDRVQKGNGAAGNNGLPYAIEKFDPSKWCGFAGQAANEIKQAIRRAARDEQTVSVSQGFQAKVASYGYNCLTFIEDHGREPSTEEQKKLMSWLTDELLLAIRTHRADSLDRAVNCDTEQITLGDTIPSPKDAITELINQEKVVHIIQAAHLTFEQEVIFILYLKLDPDEIAPDLFSREAWEEAQAIRAVVAEEKNSPDPTISYERINRHWNSPDETVRRTHIKTLKTLRRLWDTPDW